MNPTGRPAYLFLTTLLIWPLVQSLYTNSELVFASNLHNPPTATIITCSTVGIQRDSAFSYIYVWVCYTVCLFMHACVFKLKMLVTEALAVIRCLCFTLKPIINTSLFIWIESYYTCVSLYLNHIKLHCGIFYSNWITLFIVKVSNLALELSSIHSF